MKKCAKCKQSKSIDMFARHSQAKDGLQAWCNPCKLTYSKTVRQKKKRSERERALSSDPSRKRWKRKYALDYHTSVHGRAVKLLNAARARAIREKVAFDMSLDWLEEKLSRGVCELSGVPLFLGEIPKGKHRHPRGPSLDRIRHGKGYTERNVRVVCWQANIARSEWDDDVLLDFAKALVRTISSQSPKGAGSTTIPKGSRAKRLEAPSVLH